MKIQDAINILELKGEISQKSVKDAYRKASSKYHPDKGGSNEMMQAVNAAYESLKNYDGDISSFESNDYAENLNAAILAVVGLAGIDVEICGAWVWVSGDTRQHKDALKSANYKWAAKKKMWHFRPAEWKSASRGSMHIDDIRCKYGSQHVTANGFKQPARIQGAA